MAKFFKALKVLKGSFLGERPDGRPRMGFTFWAVLLLVPTVGVIVFFRNSNEMPRNPTGRGANTPRIAQAIQGGGVVKEAQPTTNVAGTRTLPGVSEVAEKADRQLTERNTKRSEASQSPPGNALDAAAVEATRAVEEERPVIPDAGVLPGSSPLGQAAAQAAADGGPSAAGAEGLLARFGSNYSVPPTTTADRPQTYNPGSGNSNRENVVYRRKKIESPDKPALAGPVTPPAQTWEPDTFLPRGTTFTVYLLDMVRTDSPQPIIIFAVARDVKFHGKVLIPFGWTILASAMVNTLNGTRIQITPSSLQDNDGKEVPLNAVIKGVDGAAGMPAYYIPPPLFKQFEVYVNDFLSGYLNMLYTKQMTFSQIRLGTLSLSSPQPIFDPKDEALSVTSGVIRDFAQRQMTELQARYAPYLIVPPGSVAQIQLLAPLSLKGRLVDAASAPDRVASVASTGTGEPARAPATTGTSLISASPAADVIRNTYDKLRAIGSNSAP